MKKNVKLLILSLIASLAFTSAFASCNTGGSNSSDTGSGSGSVSNSGDVDDSGNDNSSDNSGDSSDTSGGNSGDTESDISITLPSAETIMQFESKQLTALISGTEEDDVITWTSSNPEVATVENGLVNALTQGTATITVSVGDVSASCVVTVTETIYLHEIALSLDTVSMYVEKSQSITAGVTFKGEAIEGDFKYDWELISGEDGVISITQDGDTITFVGLKPGTVKYVVYTDVRGYEASAEIEITVKETSYSLGVDHEKVQPVAGGYTVDLVLGSEGKDSISGISAYLAINGEAKPNETVDVTWTTDNDNITFADGTITAQKFGSTALTGTAMYNGKEAKVVITVNVKKAEIALNDTMDIESVKTTSITLPDSVSNGEVQVVKLGETVLYRAGEYGSINGKELTVAKADLPVKDKELGKGKTLTIETDFVIYTMSVNVYTMIINNKAELNEWQAIAAQNAIDAGMCIPEQKGLVYSGYFILGGNIEYNDVWTTYRTYSGGEDHGLWGLCYNNPSIWKNAEDFENGKTGDAGQLLDGAIQEDWGSGNKAGFKGTFDGNGYYINGLHTSGTYSGFVVTLGNGGVIKNVSFTNAKIDSAASLVINRGNGRMENIFVSVAAIENGTAADKVTAILGVSGNSPTREIENVIIDVSKVNLSNWKYGQLADVSAANANGVYILGANGLEATKTEWVNSAAAAFWHYNVDNDVAAVFSNVDALMKDSTHSVVVQNWTGMWEVTSKYVLPKSVVEMYSGNFEIVADMTKIPGGTSLTITSDKAPAYVTYALKSNVTGVKVEGNVITVAENVKAGVQFTVVATSLIDGTKVEKNFLTDYPVVVLEDEIADIEFVETKAIALPSSVQGTVSKVTIGSCVVYDKDNALGSINGKVITPASLPVKEADLGKGVIMTVSTDKATYKLSVNVYTMIIDNKAELNEWQAVAADNSVKAGLCVEEQKEAVLSGYFILGADIEYNDNWKPILPYAGVNPSIYNLLCDAKANELKTQYADDAEALSQIINEDWGKGAKAGFRGTFDGDGHYINGLWVGNGYSGFVITMGSGTIKNVAFTNAKVGSTSAVVANRGPSTIENVYVSVVGMESGSDANNPTSIISRGSDKTLKNIVVDVSAINLKNIEYAYVVNLVTGSSENVYVLGAGDAIYNRTPHGANANNFSATDKSASVYYELNSNTASVGDYDFVGSFATAADLLADVTHGDIVKAWNGAFWSVGEGYLLPASVAGMTSNGFEIVVEMTSIPADTSMVLSTNELPAYMQYSLKEAVAGISIEGNVITVSADAELGASFTVVATSTINGDTAEIVLKVAREIVEIDDTFIVDLSDTQPITLPESIEGEVSKVMIGSVVVYDAENGIGSLNGNTITLGNVASLETSEEVSMKVETAEKIYAMNISVCTKVIKTADDLKALGVGGNRGNTESIYGYYILGNDITFEHADDYSDLVAAGYPLSDAYSFYGTFDGRGHTLHNMRVSDGGIFGIMRGTVKNLNLTDVYMIDNPPAGVSNQNGGYISIFALAAPSGTFENINISIASAPSEWTWKRFGLLVNTGSWGATTFRDITIDAEGMTLKSLLGISHNDNNVYENVVIKAAGYTAIGYTADSWAAGDVENKAALMTQLPDGVTFEVAADLAITNMETTMMTGSSLKITTLASTGVDVTLSMKEAVDGVSLNGDVVIVAETATVGATFTIVAEAGDQTAEKTFIIIKSYTLPAHYVTDTNYVNKAQYSGNETALGFAAGTYVFEVTTGHVWNDRVIIPADSSYDYVEFDVVLTKDAHLTAWPAKDKATYGSMSLNGGGMTTSDGNKRTVQVFDANGNTMDQQHVGGFKANQVYTVRIYFVEGEDLNQMHFGTGTAQTYYVANVTFGNVGTRNDVYDCATGELLAKYNGDVTALGFAEGALVSERSITDGWASRVRVDGNIGYDYLDVQFAFKNGAASIASLTVWIYGTDSKIIAGNYSVTATGCTVSGGATARNIKILDADGNAVTALTENTLYTLRVYLNGDASSIAVSSFNTDANDPSKLYFGNITYGND